MMRFSLLKIRGLAAFALLFAIIVTAAPVVLAQYDCDVPVPAEVRTGSLSAADPTQTSRVFRDGIPSSCTGGVPTAAPVAGAYAFDSYTFTNPTGLDACVTVFLDASGCGTNSTQVNAYSTFNPANVMSGLIGKPGFSTTGTGRLGFPVAAGASFTVVVHDVVNEATNTYCPNYTIRVTYNTACRQAGFDRDNITPARADPTVWRPSNGTWYTFSANDGFSFIQFGSNADIITAGDYRGTNATDYAVFRPGNSTWYVGRNNTVPSVDFDTIQFGAPNDIPVPGDYDGDGKQDVAVWRPANGTWYALRSSTGTLLVQQWGQNGDTPVWGDYDGDLISDFGLVRASGANRLWLVLQSNFGYGFVLGCPTTVPICSNGVQWGLTTDKLVPGDYDGDARTDVAVWRPSDGTWYWIRSSSKTVGNTPGATSSATQWGALNDIPQPADYDGDKTMDFAVFRANPDPTQNFWFIRNSTGGTLSAIEWGQQGDQPATAPYKIQ
ncbi:MAG TPA: VCBS repeat-containing protein [Pyrinomonadaceae bacterium]|jgi:hypothetical protein